VYCSIGKACWLGIERMVVRIHSLGSCPPVAAHGDAGSTCSLFEKTCSMSRSSDLRMRSRARTRTNIEREDGPASLDRNHFDRLILCTILQSEGEKSIYRGYHQVVSSVEILRMQIHKNRNSLRQGPIMRIISKQTRMHSRSYTTCYST
jgi:hypothetical protein